ncbi:MAG: YggL family protein [Akkermansiaceae bacterium]|jgi:hypothetical protein|nr:YggL family protein [Akkermansiaceae bacterium]
MKKRLRKKLHRGEFAIQGISLRASFTHDLTTTEFDAFVDDFIEQAIEARGLSFGGGGDPATGWNGVIEPKAERSRVEQDDLEWVGLWLGGRGELRAFEFSEPWDISNQSNPFG